MKLTGKFSGGGALSEFLKSLADRQELAKIVSEGADDLKAAFAERVPSDTGELEGALTTRPQELKEDKAIYLVGVPAESPAIDAAVATEYGSWNYGVGSPAHPKRSWESKTKASASMPWMRTAILQEGPRIKREMARKWADHLDRRTRESRAAKRLRGRLAPPKRRFRRALSMLRRVRRLR